MLFCFAKVKTRFAKVNVIENTSSGAVGPPQGPQALAELVASLYADRERLGKLAAASAAAAPEYERAQQARLMLEMLEEVAG